MSSSLLKYIPDFKKIIIKKKYRFVFDFLVYVTSFPLPMAHLPSASQKESLTINTSFLIFYGVLLNYVNLPNI